MRKKLSLCRWHIAIGYSVLGVPGMGLVIAKTVKDVLITVNIDFPLRYLFPLGLAILYLAGYLWDKLGFYQIEASHGFARSNFFKSNE